MNMHVAQRCVNQSDITPAILYRICNIALICSIYHILPVLHCLWGVAFDFQFTSCLFEWRFALSTGPLSCLSCLSVCLSVCNVCALWPNGWTDEDATWYGGTPRPKRQCVRWRPSYPLHGKGHSSSPLFGPCLLWPNGRPSQQLLLSSCVIVWMQAYACVRVYRVHVYEITRKCIKLNEYGGNNEIRW